MRHPPHPHRPPAATPIRTAYVIVNPAAGSAARLTRAQHLLEAAGLAVTVAPTAGPGDAARLAEQALRAGDSSQLVVAAGGDGTIQDVVNGLLAAGSDAASSPPRFGLLPMGTANVLAWELGIGRLEDAAQAIAAGRTRRIQTGRCAGRYFVQMAGIGFDARVAAGVSTAIKRRIGKGAYVLQSGLELARRRPPRLRLTIDGAVMFGASLIAANGRFYGGRFIACPGARLEDPWLETRLFEDGGRLDVMRYGAALLRGMGERVSGTRLLRAQRIEAVSLDAHAPPEPVQADGEIIALLPAVIEAAAAQIDVLAPILR